MGYVVCMMVVNTLLLFESSSDEVGAGSVLRADAGSEQRVNETAQLIASDCLREFSNASELLAAVQSADTCTLCVLAATSDRRYNRWVDGGLWQALAQAVCKEPDVVVGFFHYSGDSEGSIPVELGVVSTLASYSPRSFLGGRDLGELTAFHGRSAADLTSELGRHWWRSALVRCRGDNAERNRFVNWDRA